MANLLSRFINNRNGNFGMMVAIAFPALIASVALGLDISNTLSTKTQLQDANDAAVLSAARYFKENRKQPTLAEVQSFLDSNSSVKVTLKTLSFDKAKSEFTLDSTAAANTILMGYFGKKSQSYQAVSKANFGFSDTLEFALALDTTGSMAADGKMDGLKVAANDFIDTMFDAKDRGADIRGSIVPFAQYVNVGIGQKGEPWLNVPKDIDTRITTRECRKETPVSGETNCRTSCYPAGKVDYPAVPGSCSTVDGFKSCTPATAAYSVNYDAGCNKTCDPIYGPEQTVCSDVTTGDLITWQGIVGSRDYPLNVKDSNYSKRIPGLLNVVGPAELQPLTNDRKSLLNTIASLTPNGETYLPEGVMWGTRLLTVNDPFSEGKTTGKGGNPIRKTLVVMTDGTNTLSPNGAYHTNTDAALADKYTAEACDEAKAQQLEVFTISFGSAVPNSVKDLLETCASKPDNFFHAKNAAELKLAFEGIAREMLNVRLSQ